MSARRFDDQLPQTTWAWRSPASSVCCSGDIALPRIDEICQALQLEFAELPTCVADMQLLVTRQTKAQENAVVEDKKPVAGSDLSAVAVDHEAHRFQLPPQSG